MSASSSSSSLQFPTSSPAPAKAMSSSSQFMDKQILGLSASPSGSQSPSQSSASGGDFLDQMKPQGDSHRINDGGGDGGMIKKEEILPSYDFQPIRAIGSSSSPPTAAGFSGSVSSSWATMDSKIASFSIKSADTLEPHELTKVSHEKDRSAYDASTVAEIDQIVKKHADNLLHALEGVSSRLSQLESSNCHLENTVDELKVTIENNNEGSDEKLKQLENIIREVRTGVQVLQDKQEIMEAQLHLPKVEASKAEYKQPENSNTGHSEPQLQQVLSQQLVQQPYQPSDISAQPSNHLPVLAPNAPPTQQNPPQFSSQIPGLQMPSVPPLPRDSYNPSLALPMEATHQQYQVPNMQLQQPPPAPPPTQYYQSAPQHTQYHQPTHSQQLVNPPPLIKPPVLQHPEESAPYIPPPHTYLPSIRQLSPFPQPPSAASPQQFFGSNPSMYEPPTSKPSSGQPPFPSGYASSMVPSFSEPYPYSGSPSRHRSSTMKPSPFLSSGEASSGGSGNYPQLPTAQILPQAHPTTSDSNGGSSGTRAPFDDVVEKVATMGFSREQVRATVRRLTESGQSVDLNAVLDKLMNNREIQPQRGWSGR